MSNVVRWEPLRDMVTLREAMDRLFEDSFVGPRWGLPGFQAEGSTLAVDMYETEDDVVVTASVAGVKPEDINISITGDLLEITGETHFEEKVEKSQYVRQERRYGQFRRTLSLPASVQADQAEATFENGVLTLTLPKMAEAKPKTIKIVAK